MCAYDITQRAKNTIDYARDKGNGLAAINTLKGGAVTLENIPEEIAILRDGTRFVYVQDLLLHIYYSEEKKPYK
ncbi:unnamed protein product [Strongylus vulgaris]|uniref:Uncharacterized protein n=1 Tax=Strongylus vulgaris TaxID=40348 RepID=A0A3P7JGN5_STRVU|nr:unnamed protein product [Strongylus vulgaris]